MNTNTSPLAILAALVLGASPVLAQTEAQPGGPARNVVLVHGALVDGSGWRAVHDLLMADDYTVGRGSDAAHQP